MNISRLISIGLGIAFAAVLGVAGNSAKAGPGPQYWQNRNQVAAAATAGCPCASAAGTCCAHCAKS